MTAKRKLVVRFNQWYDPAMEARFAREPDIELRTVEREGDPDLVWPHLSQAHAFQVSSAKDELPKQWFVTESLLARCPNLLCVSSNGAGYDTVDVAACTRAGVLVVNQAGGNAQSVAEHAIGLMLDVTRQISQNDRLLRTERGYTPRRHHGQRDERQGRGPGRHRPYRHARREARAGVRHGGAGRRSLPDGGGDRATRRKGHVVRRNARSDRTSSRFIARATRTR